MLYRPGGGELDEMYLRWREGAVDTFRLQNDVKKRAVKYCKEAGGNKCVLLWRNGTLRFEGLLPTQAEKIDSALNKIPSYNSDAIPLPENVSVLVDSLDQFEETRSYWESRRKKYRSKNPHYALCVSERGPWASFYVQGRRTDLSQARKGCMVKCMTGAEYLSQPSKCYLVYEDGEFVNAAPSESSRRNRSGATRRWRRRVAGDGRGGDDPYGEMRCQPRSDSTSSAPSRSSSPVSARW